MQLILYPPFCFCGVWEVDGWTVASPRIGEMTQRMS